jgi:hypothetical protein
MSLFLARFYRSPHCINSTGVGGEADMALTPANV